MSVVGTDANARIGRDASTAAGAPPAAAAVPAVSVVIPAYNAAGYIAETLDSVFAQTFTDFEVVVVNDGSPDTAELERALAPYRGRVNYVAQENRGAAAARNTALGLARAPLVAFLDADDVWLPEYLAEQVSFIGRGGYDLVYANAHLLGAPGSMGQTYMDKAPSEGEVTAESLLAQRCNVLTSGTVARAALVREVGMFDEGMRRAHDFDLWLRVARAGGRLAYQRRPLLRHRVLATGLSGDAASRWERSITVFERVAEKYELTGGERRVLAGRLEALRAGLAAEQGKALLRAGDYAGAAEKLGAANRVLRSRKLSAALVALRVAPGLLRRVAAARAGGL